MPAPRRIYVVPVTINYRLVLEAETLIEDFLADTGQHRYIIEDDEFSRVGRVLEFVRKILAHEGAVVVRFGQPLDPFGNAVDAAGESRDRRGRRLDPARLVVGAGGEVEADAQRDAVYTRRLGGRLAIAFRAETVFLATHLVARAVFDALCAEQRSADVYRLLRLGPERLVVPLAEVERRVERLRDRIAATPSVGRIDAALAGAASGAIVAEAVRVLATYHTHPVVERVGDTIAVGVVKLLYYYQNRTAHLPREAG